MLAKSLRKEWVEYIIFFTIFVGMYGTVIGEFVFLKNNLTHFIGLEDWIWILIFIVPLLLGTLFDDLESISPVNFVCNIFASLFVIVFVYNLFYLGKYE